VFMEPARRIANELSEMGEPLTLQEAMPAYTTAIFEGAQGVLLDEWRGFHPHTTWSTVTLHHALAMIEESQADELCTLGAIRAYMTRHGAGPLPTWAPELDAKLLDPGNPTNAWQGTIRRGWPDLVLLRYAVETAGGLLDGLVVNCLDGLTDIAAKVCVGYRRASHAVIDKLPASTVPCLSAQDGLTAMLEDITPVYEAISTEALRDMLARDVAPAVVTGTGPTWQDRALSDLQFRLANPVSPSCRR
jgi:adenylosuccinate synthase